MAINAIRIRSSQRRSKDMCMCVHLQNVFPNETLHGAMSGAMISSSADAALIIFRTIVRHNIL